MKVEKKAASWAVEKAALKVERKVDAMVLMRAEKKEDLWVAKMAASKVLMLDLSDVLKGEQTVVSTVETMDTNMVVEKAAR